MPVSDQRPPLTALAESLPDTVPFVGPETIERNTGVPFRARLGANENLFPLSPNVLAAIAQSANETWKYCDLENHDLRAGIARHLAVGPDNVVVGEGVDGLLGLVARLFVGPGTSVVTSIGAYPTFNYHVTGFGGQLVTVPYRNDREDLDALLAAAIEHRATLVYLANPDNPMGTWSPAPDVQAFIDALPPTTLLLLDEAYGEMAPDGALPPIDVSRPNVLRLRSFSKAYGLAGLRVGYAVGDARLIKAFDKVRNHFGVNRTGQVAALAAIEDQPHLRLSVERIAAARDTVAAIARDNGLLPLPSATNFVTIDCGRDGAFALKILRELALRGVFIRKPMAPGLDRCIRITVGPDDALAVLRETLPLALEAARSAT